MNAYGTVLKQLIQLTGSKLSTISDVIGYDVSYISKWCNKSMLPAAKMAPEINRSMASLFAQEILSQEILGDFEKTFSTEVCPDDLENTIYTLLKENYSSNSVVNFFFVKIHFSSISLDNCITHIFLPPV